MSGRTSPAIALRELPGFEVLEADSRRYNTRNPKLIAAFLTLTIVAADVQAMTDESLARFGFSRGRFLVLICLRHCERQTSTPAELASMATVTSATMTGLLDGLVRDGYVTRKHRLDDRRRVDVKLTARGNQLLEENLPRHYARIAKMMKALNATERDTLVHLLGKLRKGIDAARAET